MTMVSLKASFIPVRDVKNCQTLPALAHKYGNETDVLSLWKQKAYEDAKTAMGHKN